MLPWGAFFPNMPESGSPKSRSSGYSNPSDRSRTSISHAVFTETKVNFFHYIYPPSDSKYCFLPRSEKEHRLPAFPKWPLMFSLNYGIVAPSLCKLWKMPESTEKATGAVCDSMNPPQSLLITRCISFYSGLGSYVTLFIQSYIPIYYVIKLTLTHAYVWKYAFQLYASIIWHLNNFPGGDFSN